MMMMLRSQFDAVDRDRSGKLTATELQSIGFGAIGKFSIETATELLKLFDLDGSGAIEFNEFSALNNFIIQIHGHFTSEDTDRSGNLNLRETTSALRKFGLTFDEPTVERFIKKYGTNYRSTYSTYGTAHSQSRRGKTNAYSRGQPFQGTLKFEDFALIAAHISHARSIFQKRDPQNTGSIKLTLSEFMSLSAEFVG